MPKAKTAVQKAEQRSLSKVTSLITVDQEPIRKKFIKNCQKTIKSFEKAETEWEYYKSKDLGEYSKWYENNFQSLENEVTSLAVEIEKLTEMINAVNEVSFFSRMSKGKAYEWVKEKKEHPETFSEEEEHEEFRNFFEDEDPFFDDDAREDLNYDGFSNEFIDHFEDYLKRNPKMRFYCEADYSFFENFFERFHEEYKKNHVTAEEKKKKNTVEESLKFIYRNLVRILHPDYRKDNDERADALWHEVQDAYQKKDIERLNTLYALYNIRKGDFRENFTISQILNVEEEFKMQLKEVRKNLRLARKQPAWGFSRLKDRKKIHSELSKKLKAELTRFLYQKKQLEKILESYEKQPKKAAKKKTALKKKSRHRDYSDEFQDSFFI